MVRCNPLPKVSETIPYDESKDMARYEGSYVEMDGKRIADYALIKSDIREALSIADQAEAYAEQ